MKFASAVLLLAALSASSGFLQQHVPLRTAGTQLLVANPLMDAGKNFFAPRDDPATQEANDEHDSGVKVVGKDFRLMGMVAAGSVALTAAAPVLSTFGSGLAAIGVPVAMAAGLLGMRTASLELECDEKSFGFKGMNKSNRIVGGLNRWEYADIVNYEFFPKGWIDEPQGPLLLYLKEVKTSPDKWNMGPGAIANSPEALAHGAIAGQVHFMPAMFDCKRLRREFEKHGVPNLQRDDSQLMESMESKIMMSMEAKIKSLEAQLAYKEKTNKGPAPTLHQEIKTQSQNVDNVVGELEALFEEIEERHGRGRAEIQNVMQTAMESHVVESAIDPKEAWNKFKDPLTGDKYSDPVTESNGVQELHSAIQTTIAADIPKSRVKSPTSQARAHPDTKTLHIVNYPKAGSCGEMEVPSKVAFLAKMLGGYQDGECSVDGYGVEEGTMTGLKKQDADKTYTIYGRAQA